MRAQRSWFSMTGREERNIERLRCELTELSRRIDSLEKKDDRTQAEVEALKTTALALASQIQEVGCAQANHVTALLRK